MTSVPDCFGCKNHDFRSDSCRVEACVYKQAMEEDEEAAVLALLKATKKK